MKCRWQHAGRLAAAVIIAVTLVACGGGSGATSPCNGSCQNSTARLEISDVQNVIARAVNEAQGNGVKATIAVVDRVGNVLAVYRMNGAPALVTISSNRGVSGGLENLQVPSELAALAKALTGAYLSSEGSALSTRTASQIVQQHFNPGVQNTTGGPLFGVQFSQLPCSDLMTRFSAGSGVGPHRSPLGLSADAGGFPLYKNGVLIGGVGVAADDNYGLDADITDRDHDLDERIAWAATYSYAAPTDHAADHITVNGLTLRYSDTAFAELARDAATAPAFSSLGGVVGALVKVPGYANNVVLAGTVFGQTTSGVRADTVDYSGLDAFVLVDATNANRYPPIAGSDGTGALSANEVRVLMQQALRVANRSRSQIRQPRGSQARVSVSIVDTNGVVLAVARTRDAPVFGTDVSLQKARTAMFNSGAYAAADLQSATSVQYLNDAVDLTAGTVQLTTLSQHAIGDYVTQLRNFLGLPNALSDGAIAFTDRAGGNLSRPFFPDGIDGNAPGPLSLPLAQWSPFQDGLQLDLVYNTLAEHIAFYLQQVGLTVSLDGTPLPPLSDVPQNCSGIARLPNGVQIFPGSVPIYRSNQLVGGIGVSGDGVDQDDMISFLGLANAATQLGSINNAPPAMRADQLAPQGQHLRYVQCPQSPFLDSAEQNVCAGQ